MRTPCPDCGRKVTIKDDSPRRVTCPDCGCRFKHDEEEDQPAEPRRRHERHEREKRPVRGVSALMVVIAIGIPVLLVGLGALAVFYFRSSRPGDEVQKPSDKPPTEKPEIPADFVDEAMFAPLTTRLPDAETVPLSGLLTDPKFAEGRLFVVRGRFYVASPAGDKPIVVVAAENGVPVNIRFRVNRALFLQLGERLNRELPARVTLRVGKVDEQGVRHVAVTNVELFTPEGAFLKAYPNDDDKSDPFLALNRWPERYVGKIVVVEAYLDGFLLLDEQRAIFQLVTNAHGARAIGLHFEVSRVLGEAVNKAKPPKGGIWARIHVRVEDRTLEHWRDVTILKAELLGPAGEVTRTIE
jgi:transcription initiation factor TFIIIB Brf1 subunit/transcription initiation factor TFIIB